MTPTKEFPHVFSCRAQCPADVEALAPVLGFASPSGIRMEMRELRDGTGQVEVELLAGHEVTLSGLRNTIRMVPDGHVMLQTLRALSLAENCMTRDFGVQ